MEEGAVYRMSSGLVVFYLETDSPKRLTRNKADELAFAVAGNAIFRKNGGVGPTEVKRVYNVKRPTYVITNPDYPGVWVWFPKYG